MSAGAHGVTMDPQANDQRDSYEHDVNADPTANTMEKWARFVAYMIDVVVPSKSPAFNDKKARTAF
jgi:hypothetical protein